MKYCAGLIFFCHLICFMISPVNGQINLDPGNPHIKAIPTRQFSIRNANHTIAQDSLGLIYIGNSSGLLTYNGSDWHRVTTEAEPVVAGGKDGTIYAGLYRDFGVLRSSLRDIHFASLTDSLVLKDKIRQVLPCGPHIYLSSRQAVYRYDGEVSEKIKGFDHPIRLFSPHRQNVYLYESGKGLYRLNGSQPQTLLTSRQIPSAIIQVTGNDRDLTLWMENGNSILLKKGNRPRYRSPGLSPGLKLKVRHAVALDEGAALGTESHGILLCNREGKISKVLDDADGLFDNRVNKLYVDHNEDLWALHPNGVSIIQTASGLHFFNRQHGIEGVINHVTRLNDTLYLATTQGVYYLPPQGQPSGFSPVSFKKIPPIHSEAFYFDTIQGRLFAVSKQGIFRLVRGQARLFYNKHCEQYTAVHQYRRNPQWLLIGLENGLSLVRYVNGLFIHQGMVEGIQGHILDLVEDREGYLWATTRYHGIYRIEPFARNAGRLRHHHFNKKESFSGKVEWVKPYALSGGMIFSTSDGLYRFDAGKNRFFRDTTLPLDGTRHLIYPVAEDHLQNIWFNAVSRKKPRIQSIYALIPGKENVRPMINVSLDPLKHFRINSIHPDRGSVVWAGGNEGLIKINLERLRERKLNYKPVLHRVVVNNDSLIAFNFAGYNQKQKASELGYDQNDVFFEYGATNYGGQDKVVYRTRLKGYQKEWSEWSAGHQREYTNLREGRYTFQIQAKDIRGSISPVLKYDFHIAPPLRRTWYAYLGYLLTGGLVAWLIFRWRSHRFAREKDKLENIIQQRTLELKQEKAKSDSLIERMLPKETAEELKSGVKSKPYFYNKITVLFGDIQGFTQIAEEMERDLLIERLNQCFLQFDAIVEKYHIEKIKTIGDAYMCAGGIPDESQSHPIEIILAAMEMLHYMEKGCGNEMHDKIWGLRIGIDTGPVVAGVIGRDKISYDIWGSTVNLASRMEALSEPGKINVSGNTYTLIKDFFICHYRGKMAVKNGGEIDMYFVEGLKPEFSDDLRGLRPNTSLRTHLQLLRLNDLEEIILEKLESLPADLYYHNLKHTVDVVTQVELIGKAEGITNQQLLLVKTAALFHDAGHLVSYDQHEKESVRMAREMLPDFHYTPEQIERICELIAATRMPPRPGNLLEEIICDADLDYLGRTDFVPVAYNLYKELKIRDKVESFEHWKKVQIDFIRQHAYFTKTARRLREVNKKKQLEMIMQEMEDRNGMDKQA